MKKSSQEDQGLSKKGLYDVDGNSTNWKPRPSQKYPSEVSTLTQTGAPKYTVCALPRAHTHTLYPPLIAHFKSSVCGTCVC